MDNTVGSLTEEQKSILIGCLLGDGTMRKKTNAHIEINHSFAQKALVDWKYEKLRNLVITPPKWRKGNGTREAYRFATRSLPCLTPLYEWFYINKRKVIPNNLSLNPLILALWFMDDGSKSRSSIYLNTQQFSKNEQEFLIKLLKQQFNIESTLNKDKIYFRIRVRTESIRSFINLIKPFVLREFTYKFPSVLTP